MLSSLLIPLSFWLCAASVGAMLYFSAAVTPVIFRALEADQARALTRALFPVYYLVLGVAALLAGLAAAIGGRPDAGLVLALVAMGFVYARFSMLPRVNALKDRALAGDEAAQSDFERTHRTSVTLNLMQIVGFLAVAYGLARGA